jgi:hypothetical protein
MLSKEFHDVLKQACYFILAVLFIPGFLLLTGVVRNESYFQIFVPIFQSGLLFWALFMGISLFSAERDQRGMEYLLSLPYSRIRLIVLKIFPRVVALLAFLSVFLIFYWNGGSNAVALSFLSFTIMYFSLFLIALSVSASSDNFFVLFFISLFSLLLFLGLLLGIFWTALQSKGYVYYKLETGPFFTAELDSFIIKLIIPVAFFTLLPLLIALVLSFKKFDVRPAKTYNRRYLKCFVPVFILGVLAAFLYAHQGLEIGYTSYYLTQDLKFIQANAYSDIKIFDGQTVSKIREDLDIYWPFWEENGHVYFESGEKILRLNTSTHAIEVLYQAPPARWIDWRKWADLQAIVFMESKRGYADTQFVVLDLISREAKTLPFNGAPVKDFSGWTVFGADQADGRRFWLSYPLGAHGEKPIVRLWEDGRIEDIGKSQKWPCYINRMLFTYTEDEIIVSKSEEGGFETIRKIPNNADYHFGRWYLGGKSLNNAPLKELYGRKTTSTTADPKTGQPYHRKYARLNLDSFEIEEIADFKGNLVYFDPESCYAYEIDEAAGRLKIYDVQHGELVLLKIFENFIPKYERNDFDIFKSGVVIKKAKKIKIYAFPDLKEAKFKKL